MSLKCVLFRVPVCLGTLCLSIVSLSVSEHCANNKLDHYVLWENGQQLE